MFISGERVFMVMENQKEILFVTGGCRSGKSEYAQNWAESQSPNRVYLATARVMDQEMADRVKRHQDLRGRGWDTIEEPLDVCGALKKAEGQAPVILLDCLTLWVTNLLLAEQTDEGIMTDVDGLIQVVKNLTVSIALVGNEVGLGIVPDNPLARRFRDLAGLVNQKIASAADRVVLTVAGQPLVIKG